MVSKPKVVLYNPDAVFYTMPLGLLAVASALDAKKYDVVIVGAGPAGLSAAIRLKQLLISAMLAAEAAMRKIAVPDTVAKHMITRLRSRSAPFAINKIKRGRGCSLKNSTERWRTSAPGPSHRPRHPGAVRPSPPA